MKLIYKGKGRWFPGIPARNLSDSEAKKYDVDFLLASGLYELDKPHKQRKERDTWQELAEEPEKSS